MKKFLNLVTKVKFVNSYSLINHIKLLNKSSIIACNKFTFAANQKKIATNKENKPSETNDKATKKKETKKSTKKIESNKSSSSEEEEIKTAQTKKNTSTNKTSSNSSNSKLATKSSLSSNKTANDSSNSNSTNTNKTTSNTKKKVIESSQSKSLKNFEVDFKNSPQNIGKLSLDYPINLNSFPKCSGKYDDPYQDYINSNRLSPETKSIIYADQDKNCRNYAPLPVVLAEGHGSVVEDVDGFRYIDCLLGYSSINYGHGNKNIHKAMVEQMSKLYMTSRAFYNNKLYEAAKLITEIFKKDKVLFMNSGVEAGETAIKMARRWGYMVKNIPNNEAKVVFAKNNFWGRTITACATSDDPSRYEGFGPYDNKSFYLVEYNNLKAVEELFQKDSNICAIMLEPIQGEAGIIIPDKYYLSGVYELCKKYNVLFIDDEVQAGLGRSGRLLACEYSLGNDVKPDIICLAKSLSNGYYPVSAVLANKNIVDLIKPGEHGSTFSANPLAMNVVVASLKELIADDGRIIKNSSESGMKLSYLIYSLNNPLVKEVRGRGLFIGVEFHSDIPIKVSDIALMLMERGLLTKQTHSHCLRITPALTIGNNEIQAIYQIFKSVLNSVAAQLNYTNSNQAVADFLITSNIKSECDEYILSNPVVEYKQKNIKQEKYKLNLMNPVNVVEEEIIENKALNNNIISDEQVLFTELNKDLNNEDLNMDKELELEDKILDDDEEQMLNDPLSQILKNQKI